MLPSTESQNPQWKILQTISNAHSRSVYTVDWSTDNIIATGCADNAIRFFVRVSNQLIDFVFIFKEATTKEFSLQFTKSNAHSTDINCIAWSPVTPSLMVSCGDDEVIKFWKYSQ